MRMIQVSAFLENRPGRLLHLFNVLAEADVNLIAHNIVDAADFGIVHMLVDQPPVALQALRDAGLTCTTTQVLEITLSDEPGAFVNRVLRPLAEANVNIEYSYAYSAQCAGQARSVIKVDDLARAEQALKALIDG
ncbi:MAG: hypothetical protein GX557_14320 [Chloroflexi bacterium]|nr:hypothetical protein [Chloroflexota bacterium]